MQNDIVFGKIRKYLRINIYFGIAQIIKHLEMEIVMKLLVTGANGYLGCGIVKKLCDDGVDVIATDLDDEYIDKRAKIIKADLFDVPEPYSFFGEPDTILHLAWRDGFKHASLNHINDLPKHYRFLSQIIQEKTKRVCVMGSMHEIGFYEGSIDENTPTKPQSLYGISKDALRNSVQLLCKEKNILFQWIRGFYIVGNSPHGSSIFSKIIQAAQKNEKTFPFTQGLNQFDFCDYDKFCDMVAAVIEQDKINGIINCCSGHPTRLAERVESFIQENNLDITLQYGAFPDRPYDSKAVWGNNSKICQIMENGVK